MNTRAELDRIVRDWLADRVVDPPRAGLAQALHRVATTDQHRRRWLGRWSRRGATRSASVRDGSDRTDDRRHGRMFGITAVAAGAGALALVATLIIPGSAPKPAVAPGAPGGTTLLVAADGSGEYATIGEAVAAAADGDTVLVRRGRYVETIVVDKAITLEGEGGREAVVIAPVSPDTQDPPLLVQDADATVRGLTVEAPAPSTTMGAVLVSGGAPLFEDVAVTVPPRGLGSFYFAEGTTATVRDSTWDGPWFIDEAPVTIEGDTISGKARIFGDGWVVRGNTFLDGGDLWIGTASGLIEGNDLTGSGVMFAGPGGDVTVRDNTFRDVHWVGEDGMAAVAVQGKGSHAEVTGNTISGSDTGVLIGGESGALVTDNRLSGNKVGLSLAAADGTLVEDNTIEQNEVAVSITAAARPALKGNIICGNGTNLRAGGENPMTLSGNWLSEGGCAAATNPPAPSPAGG